MVLGEATGVQATGRHRGEFLGVQVVFDWGFLVVKSVKSSGFLSSFILQIDQTSQKSDLLMGQDGSIV